MTDYQELLKKSWDELPKPKLLPVGSWGLRGRNAAFVEAKEEGKNSKVIFFYQATGPMEDVSETELEALGADYDFAINDLTFTVWVESAADFRKKVEPHLAKHAGWTPGANPQEGLKNFKNSEVVAFVGEKTFTRDGTTIIDNDLKNFVSPAE